MTEFVTRSFGQKEFKVIITTDNKEHYKVAEDFARKLVGHSKPSAADAVPVVHGRWNMILRGNYECSVCGCIPYYAGRIDTLNYCPNCGAKMDGGE